MSISRTSAQRRYGDRLFAHTTPGEAGRLDTGAQLWDPATISVLHELDLAPSSRCLEAGAGTGTIATWLARRCPRGRVVATELDTGLLAGRVGADVEVVRHDLVTDDFPDGSFDFVHARNVLFNIRERELVLAKMSRWLAPGGVLCVEDLSLEVAATSVEPVFAKIHAAMLAGASRVIGTDAIAWPRAYPRQLGRVGLTGLRLRVFPGVLTRGSVVARMVTLTLRAMDQVVRADGVTDADLVAFGNLLDDPDFAEIAFLMHTAIGVRPA